MLRRLQPYNGMKISAVDGESIGTVQGFYADSEQWKIRYLAVRAGDWLQDRQVLVAPQSLAQVAWDEKEGRSSLSRAAVRTAPFVDPARPPGRDEEENLARHYVWPRYWNEVPPPPASFEQDSGGVTTRIAQRTAPRLYAVGQLTGMRCIASDGDVGRIEDFVFDDTAWELRYLVVNVGPTVMEKRALVPPRWVTRINDGAGEVHVNLAQELIADSPDYDPGMQVDERFERQLCDHYGMPKNWC